MSVEVLRSAKRCPTRDANRSLLLEGRDAESMFQGSCKNKKLYSLTWTEPDSEALLAPPDVALCVPDMGEGYL